MNTWIQTYAADGPTTRIVTAFIFDSVSYFSDLVGGFESKNS